MKTNKKNYRPFGLLVSLLIAGLALGACGDSDTPTGPIPLPGPPAPPTGGGAPPLPPAPSTASTFSGTFVNGNRAGSLEVTLPVATGRSLRASSAATAFGELRPADGSAVALSGTYDEVSQTVFLSGGAFELDGSLDTIRAEISGTLSGPGGAGSFAALSTTGGSVKSFCGTADEVGTDSHGVWNLSVSASGRATGSYTGTDGPGLIRGTLRGDSLSGEWGALDGFDAGTFAGTVSGSSVNGTWRATVGGSSRGSFRGSTPCR